MARLITLFALLIALPAGAQSPDPSGKWLAERPEAGEPKNFELPEIDTVELDNGLKITFIPFGLAPKATISARIRTGNINEGENTWLADIAAELMSEGAGERTGEEIAIAAAEMGGDLEVGVDPHVTAFDMAVLSGHAPDAIALMGDVIQRPALPEDDMERVKANFIRNLSVALSQPRGQAASAFLGALYGDHPYGRVFPTEAQLRSYEIDDVRAYYEQNFGAERTRLTQRVQDRDKVCCRSANIIYCIYDVRKLNTCVKNEGARSLCLKSKIGIWCLNCLAASNDCILSISYDVLLLGGFHVLLYSYC